MTFNLPVMYDHPTGWGPPRHEDNLPFDIPYQPFSKSDRLSRIAEWVPPDTMRGRGRGGRYVPAFIREREEREKAKQEGDPEEKWTTADYHKNTRTRRMRGRGRGGMNRGAQGRRPGGGGRGAASVPKSRKKPDLRDPGFRRKDVHRTASIDVKHSWTMKTTIPLSDLKKHAEIAKTDQTGVQIPKEETLVTNGEALQFNPVFEKPSVREPMNMVNMKRALEFCSVTESPIMKTLIKDIAPQGGTQFYATEEILATLMCARQSINSWDISIERINDIYFLDWRKGSSVDRFSVNESAQDPPAHEEPQNATEEQKINIQPKLMRELTSVSHSLSQQVMKQQPVTGKRAVKEAPLSEELQDHLADEKMTAAKVIYRYKKWDVKQSRDDENPMRIVARTHIDGYVDATSTLRTFAYFDPTGIAWKQKLPMQEGAVTASEIKNNTCRVAKQTAMTLLSGADYMRMGFVARKRSDNATSHHLLHMTKVQSPHNMCMTISQTYRGMWNVLNKILLDIVKAKDPSKNHQRFVLLKEPNKGSLTLYDTHVDQDESESEDEEEEEEEEEESEEN
eukprot:TRINITY_DN74_c0_g1_i1.p2 TRINITY_DN74_c0_g1~~TRINITY_DN74_c0_g1_i1.p2  ORF type:complete len:565 (+),score=264.49 TRINITY_DN74_c0_g1_i1:70-1764(+)